MTGLFYAEHPVVFIWKGSCFVYILTSPCWSWLHTASFH